MMYLISLLMTLPLQILLNRKTLANANYFSFKDRLKAFDDFRNTENRSFEKVSIVTFM